MLKLINVNKVYKVGSNETTVLDNINLEFSNSGFVCILGASGCGKTTLLNLISGLDKPTSGDILVNNKQLKTYRNKQLDAFISNNIGYVFQDYHLIPYLNVLDNISLPLKISHSKNKNYKNEIKESLRIVNLEGYENKYPSQLSGGQAQKVAILRATINNASIILADEPTGALDKESAKVIMDLLKEISQTRLVIMVTHNKQLADEYADRIINIADHKVVLDTIINPIAKPYSLIQAKKTRMPFFTSFSLALKHLRKKKLHTLLSVFSNCIGMVALGLVISLTFGITTFIAQQESSMLSAYPITISRLAYNSPLFSSKKEDKVQIPGRVYVDEAVENITSLKQLNNLSPTYIKEVIDKINPLDVLEIKYDYGSQLNVYKEVNAVISMYVGINATANYDMTDYFSILGFGGGWLEVPKTEVLNQQYDVVYGTLPNSFDELVLVLDENNTISSAKLKLLGIGLDMDVMPQSYSYEQIASLAKFKLLSNDALFIEDGTKFKDIRRVERLGGMSFNLVDKSTYLNGVDLKVTAIVKAKEGNNLCALTTTAIGYLPELIDFVNGNTPSSIGFGKQSKIGQWMLNENTKFINPLTNVPYLDNNSNPLIGSKLDQMTTDSIIYGVGNYVNAIKIYPKTMKAKDNIFSLLNNWNDDIIRLEKDKVYYVDYISLLSTSLSSLISSISLILGIFSIISIISTLIMTATMFYNDVLERRKEIGILKALGMSSTSIGNNFVSESFIQGIIAGFIGIIITNYLAIQLGQYLHSKLKIIPVNVVMFNINIASLIFIMTVGIIMLSSIIPSLIASKTNAVTSLKSE